MRRKCYMLWMVMAVCLIFAAQPVYAASAPQLSASVDTAGVKKGETVKVKISLKNNPGISTLGLELDYDAEELEYRACDWNSGLGGNDMKMASDAQGIVNLSFVCDECYQADGTVAIVSFRAKKDVSAVDVALGLREISDENLSAVENCKVIKKVQVPAEAGTSKKQDKEAKPQQTPTKQPKSSSSSQTAATEEKTVSKTAGTTAKTVKTTANTAVNTARAADAENAKLDESYQTGVLAGSDVLVVVASVCVLVAFIIWNEQKRGTLD